MEQSYTEPLLDDEEEEEVDYSLPEPEVSPLEVVPTEVEVKEDPVVDEVEQEEIALIESEGTPIEEEDTEGPYVGMFPSTSKDLLKDYKEALGWEKLWPSERQEALESARSQVTPGKEDFFERTYGRHLEMEATEEAHRFDMVNLMDKKLADKELFGGTTYALSELKDADNIFRDENGEWNAAHVVAGESPGFIKSFAKKYLGLGVFSDDRSSGMETPGLFNKVDPREYMKGGRETLSTALTEFQEEMGFSDEGMQRFWSDYSKVNTSFDGVDEPYKVLSTGSLLADNGDDVWMDTAKGEELLREAVKNGASRQYAENAAAFAKMYSDQVTAERLGSARGLNKIYAHTDSTAESARNIHPWLYDLIPGLNNGLKYRDGSGFRDPDQWLRETHGEGAKWDGKKMMEFEEADNPDWKASKLRRFINTASIRGSGKMDVMARGLTVMPYGAIKELVPGSFIDDAAAAIGYEDYSLRQAESMSKIQEDLNAGRLTYEQKGLIGLSSKVIEEIPSLVLQIGLTRGVGATATKAATPFASAKAAEKFGRLTAYTSASTIIAGGQSYSMELANGLAEGLSFDEANEKAGKAALVTATVVSAFSLAGHGGLERLMAGSGRSMMGVTLGDLRRFAKDGGMGKAPFWEAMGTFGKGALRAYMSEAWEEGIDEWYQTLATADDDDSLAEIWTGFWEGFTVGGAVGVSASVAMSQSQTSGLEAYGLQLESTRNILADRIKAYDESSVARYNAKNSDLPLERNEDGSIKWTEETTARHEQMMQEDGDYRFAINSRDKLAESAANVDVKMQSIYGFINGQNMVSEQIIQESDALAKEAHDDMNDMWLTALKGTESTGLKKTRATLQKMRDAGEIEAVPEELSQFEGDVAALIEQLEPGLIAAKAKLGQVMPTNIAITFIPKKQGLQLVIGRLETAHFYDRETKEWSTPIPTLARASVLFAPKSVIERGEAGDVSTPGTEQSPAAKNTGSPPAEPSGVDVSPKVASEAEPAGEPEVDPFGPENAPAGKSGPVAQVNSEVAAASVEQLMEWSSAPSSGTSNYHRAPASKRLRNEFPDAYAEVQAARKLRNEQGGDPNGSAQQADLSIENARQNLPRDSREVADQQWIKHVGSLTEATKEQVAAMQSEPYAIGAVFGLPVYLGTGPKNKPDNAIYEDGDSIHKHFTFNGGVASVMIAGDGSVHFSMDGSLGLSGKGAFATMNAIMPHLKELVTIYEASKPGTKYNFHGNDKRKFSLFARYANSSGFNVKGNTFTVDPPSVSATKPAAEGVAAETVHESSGDARRAGEKILSEMPDGHYEMTMPDGSVVEATKSDNKGFVVNGKGGAAFVDASVLVPYKTQGVRLDGTEAPVKIEQARSVKFIKPFVGAAPSAPTTTTPAPALTPAQETQLAEDQALMDQAEAVADPLIVEQKQEQKAQEAKKQAVTSPSQAEIDRLRAATEVPGLRPDIKRSAEKKLADALLRQKAESDLYAPGESTLDQDGNPPRDSKKVEAKTISRFMTEGQVSEDVEAGDIIIAIDGTIGVVMSRVDNQVHVEPFAESLDRTVNGEDLTVINSIYEAVGNGKNGTSEVMSLVENISKRLFGNTAKIVFDRDGGLIFTRFTEEGPEIHVNLAEMAEMIHREMSKHEGILDVHRQALLSDVADIIYAKMFHERVHTLAPNAIARKMVDGVVETVAQASLRVANELISAGKTNSDPNKDASEIRRVLYEQLVGRAANMDRDVSGITPENIIEFLSGELPAGNGVPSINLEAEKVALFHEMLAHDVAVLTMNPTVEGARRNIGRFSRAIAALENKGDEKAGIAARMKETLRRVYDAVRAFFKATRSAGLTPVSYQEVVARVLDQMAIEKTLDYNASQQAPAAVAVDNLLAQMDYVGVVAQKLERTRTPDQEYTEYKLKERFRSLIGAIRNLDPTLSEHAVITWGEGGFTLSPTAEATLNYLVEGEQGRGEIDPKTGKKIPGSIESIKTSMDDVISQMNFGERVQVAIRGREAANALQEALYYLNMGTSPSRTAEGLDRPFTAKEMRIRAQELAPKMDAALLNRFQNLLGSPRILIDAANAINTELEKGRDTDDSRHERFVDAIRNNRQLQVIQVKLRNGEYVSASEIALDSDFQTDAAIATRADEVADISDAIEAFERLASNDTSMVILPEETRVRNIAAIAAEAVATFKAGDPLLDTTSVDALVHSASPMQVVEIAQRIAGDNQVEVGRIIGEFEMAKNRRNTISTLMEFANDFNWLIGLDTKPSVRRARDQYSQEWKSLVSIDPSKPGEQFDDFVMDNNSFRQLTYRADGKDNLGEEYESPSRVFMKEGDFTLSTYGVVPGERPHDASSIIDFSVFTSYKILGNTGKPTWATTEYGTMRRNAEVLGSNATIALFDSFYTGDFTVEANTRETLGWPIVVKYNDIGEASPVYPTKFFDFPTNPELKEAGLYTQVEHGVKGAWKSNADQLFKHQAPVLLSQVADFLNKMNAEHVRDGLYARPLNSHSDGFTPAGLAYGMIAPLMTRLIVKMQIVQDSGNTQYDGILGKLVEGSTGLYRDPAKLSIDGFIGSLKNIHNEYKAEDLNEYNIYEDYNSLKMMVDMANSTYQGSMKRANEIRAERERAANDDSDSLDSRDPVDEKALAKLEFDTNHLRRARSEEDRKRLRAGLNYISARELSFRYKLDMMDREQFVREGPKDTRFRAAFFGGRSFLDTDFLRSQGVTDARGRITNQEAFDQLKSLDGEVGAKARQLGVDPELARRIVKATDQRVLTMFLSDTAGLFDQNGALDLIELNEKFLNLVTENNLVGLEKKIEMDMSDSELVRMRQSTDDSRSSRDEEVMSDAMRSAQVDYVMQQRRDAEKESADKLARTRAVALHLITAGRVDYIQAIKRDFMSTDSSGEVTWNTTALDSFILDNLDSLGAKEEANVISGKGAQAMQSNAVLERITNVTAPTVSPDPLQETRDSVDRSPDAQFLNGGLYAGIAADRTGRTAQELIRDEERVLELTAKSNSRITKASRGMSALASDGSLEALHDVAASIGLNIIVGTVPRDLAEYEGADLPTVVFRTDPQNGAPVLVFPFGMSAANRNTPVYAGRALAMALNNLQGTSDVDLGKVSDAIRHSTFSGAELMGQTGNPSREALAFFYANSHIGSYTEAVRAEGYRAGMEMATEKGIEATPQMLEPTPKMYARSMERLRIRALEHADEAIKVLERAQGPLVFSFAARNNSNRSRIAARDAFYIAELISTPSARRALAVLLSPDAVNGNPVFDLTEDQQVLAAKLAESMQTTIATLASDRELTSFREKATTEAALDDSTGDSTEGSPNPIPAPTMAHFAFMHQQENAMATVMVAIAAELQKADPEVVEALQIEEKNNIMSKLLQTAAVNMAPEAVEEGGRVIPLDTLEDRVNKARKQPGFSAQRLVDEIHGFVAERFPQSGGFSTAYAKSYGAFSLDSVINKSSTRNKWSDLRRRKGAIALAEALGYQTAQEAPGGPTQILVPRDVAEFKQRLEDKGLTTYFPYIKDKDGRDVLVNPSEVAKHENDEAKVVWKDIVDQVNEQAGLDVQAFESAIASAKAFSNQAFEREAQLSKFSRELKKIKTEEATSYTRARSRALAALPASSDLAKRLAKEIPSLGETTTIVTRAILDSIANNTELGMSLEEVMELEAVNLITEMATDSASIFHKTNVRRDLMVALSEDSFGATSKTSTRKTMAIASYNNEVSAFLETMANRFPDFIGSFDQVFDRYKIDKIQDEMEDAQRKIADFGALIGRLTSPSAVAKRTKTIYHGVNASDIAKSYGNFNDGFYSELRRYVMDNADALQEPGIIIETEQGWAFDPNSEVARDFQQGIESMVFDNVKPEENEDGDLEKMVSNMIDRIDAEAKKSFLKDSDALIAWQGLLAEVDQMLYDGKDRNRDAREFKAKKSPRERLDALNAGLARIKTMRHQKLSEIQDSYSKIIRDGEGSRRWGATKNEVHYTVKFDGRPKTDEEVTAERVIAEVMDMWGDAWSNYYMNKAALDDIAPGYTHAAKKSEQTDKALKDGLFRVREGKTKHTAISDLVFPEGIVRAIDRFQVINGNRRMAMNEVSRRLVEAELHAMGPFLGPEITTRAEAARAAYDAAIRALEATRDEPRGVYQRVLADMTNAQARYDKALREGDAEMASEISYELDVINDQLESLDAQIDYSTDFDSQIEGLRKQRNDLVTEIKAAPKATELEGMPDLFAPGDQNDPYVIGALNMKGVGNPSHLMKEVSIAFEIDEHIVVDGKLKKTGKKTTLSGVVRGQDEFAAKKRLADQMIADKVIPGNIFIDSNTNSGPTIIAQMEDNIERLKKSPGDRNALARFDEALLKAVSYLHSYRHTNDLAAGAKVKSNKLAAIGSTGQGWIRRALSPTDADVIASFLSEKSQDAYYDLTSVVEYGIDGRSGMAAYQSYTDQIGMFLAKEKKKIHWKKRDRVMTQGHMLASLESHRRAESDQARFVDMVLNVVQHSLSGMAAFKARHLTDNPIGADKGISDKMEDARNSAMNWIWGDNPDISKNESLLLETLVAVDAAFRQAQENGSTTEAVVEAMRAIRSEFDPAAQGWSEKLIGVMADAAEMYSRKMITTGVDASRFHQAVIVPFQWAYLGGSEVQLADGEKQTLSSIFKLEDASWYKNSRRLPSFDKPDVIRLDGSQSVIAMAKDMALRAFLYDGVRVIEGATGKHAEAPKNQYEKISDGYMHGIAGELGYDKTRANNTALYVSQIIHEEMRKLVKKGSPSSRFAWLLRNLGMIRLSTVLFSLSQPGYQGILPAAVYVAMAMMPNATPRASLKSRIVRKGIKSLGVRTLNGIVNKSKQVSRAVQAMVGIKVLENTLENDAANENSNDKSRLRRAMEQQAILDDWFRVHVPNVAYRYGDGLTVLQETTDATWKGLSEHEQAAAKALFTTAEAARYAINQLAVGAKNALGVVITEGERPFVQQIFLGSLANQIENKKAMVPDGKGGLKRNRITNADQEALIARIIADPDEAGVTPFMKHLAQVEVQMVFMSGQRQKLGEFFQPGENVYEEIRNGTVKFLAGHTTQTGALASAATGNIFELRGQKKDLKRKYKGALKAGDKQAEAEFKAEMARINRDMVHNLRPALMSIGQNAIYNLFRWNVMTNAFSKVWGLFAGWNDEERKRAEMSWYGLEYGVPIADQERMMQPLVNHLFRGTSRPFGVDTQTGEYDERRHKGDVWQSLHQLGQDSVLLGVPKIAPVFQTNPVRSAVESLSYGVASSGFDAKMYGYNRPGAIVGSNDLKMQDMNLGQKMAYGTTFAWRNYLAEMSAHTRAIDAAFFEPLISMTNAPDKMGVGETMSRVAGDTLLNHFSIPRESRKHIYGDLDPEEFISAYGVTGHSRGSKPKKPTPINRR